MSSSTSEYRPDIDGLRGIAVLLVVLFHAHISFRGGYIGVDVFFVISGYLITLLMMRDMEAGRFSLAEFWERRFRRIFPALAVMILVTIGFGFLFLLPADLVNFAASLRAQTVFISNLFFWSDAGDYFAGPTEQKPLLHTWSLAVEEQFYILMPLLCMFIQRQWSIRSRRLTLRETSFYVFSWLLGLSFITSVVVTFIDPNTSFYWLHTRAWELLLGASLSCLPEEKWKLRAKHRVTLSWLALLVILVIGWVYNKRTSFPGLAAAPPCLATAFLIWAGHPRFGKSTITQILGARPLVKIGLASYSFYLWHWPILAFMNYLNPGPGDAIPKAARVGLMVGVFLIALASLQWIETPIRKRLWLTSRKSLFTTTIFVLLLFFGIGWLIEANSGFPQRLDPQVYKIAESGIKDRQERKQRNWYSNPKQAFTDTLPMLGSTAESAPIRVLVWGDSHAFSIAPVISTLCKENNVKGLLAAYSATVPIVGGFYRANSSGLDSRSPAWAAAVVNLIKKHHIPDTIITAHWKESVGKNEAQFNEALLHTIDELKATGTRVWVMMDVPDLGFEPPKALAFYHMLAWGYPDPKKLTPTIPSHEKANRVMQSLVPRLQAAGAMVLDPSPFLFGPSGHCLIQVNEDVIYFDAHHLTISGALRLKPLFAPLFKTQSQP